MIIDDFYSGINSKEKDKVGIDKSSFYLGMVTQVQRSSVTLQVENISLISHREIRSESLIPNTINYYVVIESIKGLFFGEVYKTRIANSDNVHLANKEKTWPEIEVEILAVMKNGEDKFDLAGSLTVGLMDKVYIANRKIIDKFFESINANNNSMEKSLPSFATLASNGKEVTFMPSTLFDKHLMIIGATNSGKSTSALSILDKLINENIRVLIIDPTGEYKNSFSDDKVEKLELGINTKISTGQLNLRNWTRIFDTNDNTQPGVLYQAIKSLKYQFQNDHTEECYKKENEYIKTVDGNLTNIDEGSEFNLKILYKQVLNESVKTSGIKYVLDDFKLASNMFLSQKIEEKTNNPSFIKFFSGSNSSQEKDMKDLIKEVRDFATGEQEIPKSLYIDSSTIGATNSIGGGIIDIICENIITLEKKDISPFVIFIDEVHRYTKNSSLETPDFYSGLTSIAREGRKKGIFLFLTTQNPNDVDKVLLGQVGTLLIHRLTQYDEINAIQNHLNNHRVSQVKKLSTGEAILTSVNLLSDLDLKINKCGREHDSETPSLWTGS